MMRWQLTDPPSDVGLARFIASLNLRELQELRRLAQQTRADGAVNWPAARPYAGDDYHETSFRVVYRPSWNKKPCRVPRASE